ncbi:hypothetical protein [Streptomyces albus]|uniref:hypothetical protein n=1 Tax=Streptomyces albus TaxID=1888 RepID=UPI001FADBBC1|nr:hypothetical protein [Streptomyces albus]
MELTACRGASPYPTRTWDPQARLFREGAAGIAYPVTGWGHSEVGEVTEVSPESNGTPGLPGAGDLDWPAWLGALDSAGHPGHLAVECRVPPGSDPAEAVRSIPPFLARMSGPAPASGVRR